MTPSQAVLALSEVGIFTSVLFLAVVLIAGWFPRPKPADAPEVKSVPPVSILESLADRTERRAKTISFEVGPNSSAQHLQHIAEGYREASK